MDFNNLIPELSVFDILQTKNFYEELGFKIEYERQEEKFVWLCHNKWLILTRNSV